MRHQNRRIESDVFGLLPSLLAAGREFVHTWRLRGLEEQVAVRLYGSIDVLPPVAPSAGATVLAARCLLRSESDRIAAGQRNDAMGHVWTAPGWQEESSRCRVGRCSHVFGLFARFTMTAGHNALRGSGPGQKHAFLDAMALVGCPDRRVDRRCIKCCSPSQPLRHTGCPV